MINDKTLLTCTVNFHATEHVKMAEQELKTQLKLNKNKGFVGN